MPGPIQMQVSGIEPIVRRFKDPNTAAEPVRDFYKDSRRVIRRNVQRGMPIRLGRGKRSVRGSGISRRRMPRLVKVFTRLYYLRFLEFGTVHMAARRVFLRGLQVSMPDIRRGLIRLEADLVKRLKGEARV